MFPPCVDSGSEWAIGVTGKDDVFFPPGVIKFLRENVLGIRGFFGATVDEPSSARKTAFSISELVLRILKLSFGRKVLIVDLFFDEEGRGDSLIL